MTFNIFGYTVSIEKNNKSQYQVNEDYIYMTYDYAKKAFLEKLGLMYSKEYVINQSRLPAIKALREMVKEELGYPLSLRQAKEFVEEYYDYKGD